MDQSSAGTASGRVSYGVADVEADVVSEDEALIHDHAQRETESLERAQFHLIEHERYKRIARSARAAITELEAREALVDVADEHHKQHSVMAKRMAGGVPG